MPEQYFKRFCLVSLARTGFKSFAIRGNQLVFKISGHRHVPIITPIVFKNHSAWRSERMYRYTILGDYRRDSIQFYQVFIAVFRFCITIIKKNALIRNSDSAIEHLIDSLVFV